MAVTGTVYISKSPKTKAPTNLKITRSGDTYKFSWKIGDKNYNSGQNLFKNYTDGYYWYYSWNSIGKKTTSYSVKLPKSNYYPIRSTQLNYIEFGLSGRREPYVTGTGYSRTGWYPTTSRQVFKRFTLKPPKKPTIKKEVNTNVTNACKFTWNVSTSNTDVYVFTRVQWQSVIKKDCSEKDGSKISWSGCSSGTGSASGNHTFTEDTSKLYKDGASYKRWFRVRSQGPAGDSGWAYSSHVYAIPNKASIKSASAKETKQLNLECTISWEASQSNGLKPIDKTVVQYAIVTPDENLLCPSNATWEEGTVSKDTANTDSAVFIIDKRLQRDQCLYLRVNTHHDRNVSYSVPKLVTINSVAGYLKDPSDLSVQTDNTTHRAIITATNNSDVEDSVIVVRYIPSTGNAIECGIIPHGSSSVTVQCPNWDSLSAIAFEVYAMVGTFSKQTRSDGADAYSVTPKMKSKNTISDGGTVPVAPQNISVSRVDGKDDTVEVTWDWPWSAAGSAELSWSDHDDAWESTDEPEAYTINNLHASKWRISGLETGKIWYVRVRLIAGDISDPNKVTYGSYSDINQGIIDLSSEPDKPVLTLSNPIILEDGYTTASWVYSSADKTDQSYAEVALILSVYLKSTDTRVISGKTYYNLEAETVSIPALDYISLYYETAYRKTKDTSLVTGKDYYTLSGSYVSNPAVEDISYYYTYKNSTYTKVTDNYLISGTNYYTITATLVSNPSSGSLSSYYETYYIKSKDTEIDVNKTYYTVTGTKVESPVRADVKNYYEMTDQIYASIAHTLTTQHVTIDANLAGFTSNNIYNIACRVKSSSGRFSEWSDLASITVVEPLTCTITQISLVEKTETLTVINPDSTETTETRTFLALTELPLTVTATGAGDGGITSAVIKCADDYSIERPDEQIFNGYKDEIVVHPKTVLGENQISFNLDDVINYLDESSSYKLIVTIHDGIGRTAQSETEFEIRWDHQAIIPEVTVEIDEEKLIAKITPFLSDDSNLYYYTLTADSTINSSKTYYTRSGAGTEQSPYIYTAVQSPSVSYISTYYEKLSYGDVVDIYRLSIDKPELIYANADFGSTYVDPYPTLGEMGGYRVVYKTKDNDYTTQDGRLAYIDSTETAQPIIKNADELNIINFEKRQIKFYYDTDYSSSWSKDFQENKYLGGSVQGDWNAAITRTGNINTLAITVLDQDMLQDVRRLASYPGICHVRTADGSSYAADVQVSEDRVHTDKEMLVSYSLSITRVDSEGLDGMTLAQYEEENSEPEEEEE